MGRKEEFAEAAWGFRRNKVAREIAMRVAEEDECYRRFFYQKFIANRQTNGSRRSRHGEGGLKTFVSIEVDEGHDESLIRSNYVWYNWKTG